MTHDEKTMSDLFYKQISALNKALTKDQKAMLYAFLNLQGALEHYREMVAPSEPNPDESQRDQDAAMRAFCVFQCIPENEWQMFFNIIGDLKPRFDAAMEKVKERFAGIPGVDL